MEVFDTNTEKTVVIECYNNKYLKVDQGNLTGSYIGGTGHQERPFFAVFKQFIVNMQGYYAMCYTITYRYEGERYFVAISRKKRVVLHPAVEERKILNNPEAFLGCFFKQHQLSGGLSMFQLESVLHKDELFTYNDETGVVEFQQRAGLLTQLFKLHILPLRNQTNSTNRINRNICFRESI